MGVGVKGTAEVELTGNSYPVRKTLQVGLHGLGFFGSHATLHPIPSFQDGLPVWIPGQVKSSKQE